MVVCLEHHRDPRLVDRVGVGEQNFPLSLELDSFDHRARPEDRVLVWSSLGQFSYFPPLSTVGVSLVIPPPSPSRDQLINTLITCPLRAPVANFRDFPSGSTPFSDEKSSMVLPQ